MILNLLRVEELRVEDMMRRSFFEAGNQRESADLKATLEASKTQLQKVRGLSHFLATFAMPLV